MATEAERVARDEQLEAILGLKMLHPNIVRTFQFATKDRTVDPLWPFLHSFQLPANVQRLLCKYESLSNPDFSIKENFKQCITEVQPFVVIMNSTLPSDLVTAVP